MENLNERVLKGAAVAGATAAVLKLVDDRHAVSHDIKILSRLIPVVRHARNKAALAEWTMTDEWEEAVEKYGSKTAIVFEDRRHTFDDMDHMSCRMAHWLVKQGIKPGDCVSLDMENCPEFVCWWLAVTRIGGKPGLLNYNIKQKGLVHCVQVSKAVALICHADTEENVAEVQDQLTAGGAKIFYFGHKTPHFVKTEYTITSDMLLGLPSENTFSREKYRKGVKYTDIFGYIYTSGTTGLPKAANIMHMKMAYFGKIVGHLLGVTESDIVYTCLPIFHSAGGGIGISTMINTGATCVLSKKFSAKRYWRDVSLHNVTICQYIGELARYLVAYAKTHPEVYKYPKVLRAAIGNGLRPEVWDDFQDGFEIPTVAEFYGATEGNGSTINLCDRSNKAARGAVGRMGTLLSKVQGMKIAKFDVEAEEPVRGSDGFCIECAPGEQGELLCPIKESVNPTTKFAGYTDEKASAKKLISDAFAKGDQYFRTGDLLFQDTRGFIYFGDRIGDTFRWKGENVSTMEVSEVISAVPGVLEANVYGIKVPGSDEGQGCCAALTMKEPFSDEINAQIVAAVKKNLPPYARPLFLRVLKNIGPMTQTFKQQKMTLRQEGCDPEKTKPDDILWWDAQKGVFAPFNTDIQGQMEARSVKANWQ